jgi:hypothetical protein
VKKWEYKVLRLPCDRANLEEELNTLGNDGWELCSSGTVATNFQPDTRVLLLTFKRENPKPQTPPPSQQSSTRGIGVDAGVSAGIG